MIATKTEKLVWEPIREPHLYGYRATIGDRTVDVIRTDAGNREWAVYGTIAGRTIRAGPWAPNRVDMATAREAAIGILRRKVFVETW